MSYIYIYDISSLRVKSDRESINILHNFIISHIHCAQVKFLVNILTPKLGGIFVFAQ